ncbi:MAG TPA: D-alanine--D-alanine ligase family protein [Chloroflexota bacterium]|nr:D-alanine--D-alanine ligase family protein [Chloroflexota bacterium]
MREQRRKQRVAVIFGSRSVEHEVSVISAVQAMDAMDPRRYEPLPIYITREGRWITGPELRRIDSYKDQQGLLNRCRPVVLRPEPFGNRLFMEEPGPLGTKRTRVTVVDVVFPVVHGTFGEDGTLQGLLELAGVPYVGAGVVGSAVGMDKIVMKAAFQAQDLPVVNYLWFTRKRWQSAADEVAAEIERTLRYPLFVKPANLGSSIGISRANDRAGLFDAIEVAAHYDRRLLVEEAFEGGIEVNCSVLGNDDPQASVCEQPIAWTEILSYEDKYLRGGGGKGKGSGGSAEGMASLTRRIPAPVAPELTAEIQRLAVEAFKAVDCAGLARVDFLVDPVSGRIAVNEINTMPGSLSFYLWEPSGVPFPALVDRLIALALERHRERQQTTYNFDSALLQKFSRGKAQ